MTAPVTTARPRPRLLVILVYTLQSCLPPRRWAAVLAASAGALLFGLLSHAVNAPTADRAFANVAAEGILGLVTCLGQRRVGMRAIEGDVLHGCREIRVDRD